MRKVEEEVGAILRKTQEEIKRQADRKCKEVERWKRRDKLMLSTKDLVFKKRLVRKLTEQYVGPYTIEEVVSLNMIKLSLLVNIRIH